ncbi:N-acetylglucosamine-6-phosphate deacetylase [Terrilactibacillus sp. S3-3]|nr:N-acetylglucosamine-6-phosphate deacetylase [Terrilactibacillus sp. S3-3]
MRAAIKGCSILSGGTWLRRGYLEYNQGKISYVGPANEREKSIDRVYEFPEDYKCIPGMIDVHIHGVNGSDTMDATPEALHNIAYSLPKEATTSFLATTITQSKESIEKALKNVSQYFGHQKPGEAEIIGIHLEGPFINKEKAGAQPLEYIIDADIAVFEKWQQIAGGRIKLVTIAPEIKNGLALIEFFSRHGVVASIGHSNGTYNDVVNAIKAGATHVTHLYNGMRGLHHREPGILGGALLHRELYTEMIVDGYHIQPGNGQSGIQIEGRRPCRADHGFDAREMLEKRHL